MIVWVLIAILTFFFHRLQSFKYNRNPAYTKNQSVYDEETCWTFIWWFPRSMILCWHSWYGHIRWLTAINHNSFDGRNYHNSHPELFASRTCNVPQVLHLIRLSCLEARICNARISYLDWPWCINKLRGLPLFVHSYWVVEYCRIVMESPIYPNTMDQILACGTLRGSRKLCWCHCLNSRGCPCHSFRAILFMLFRSWFPNHSPRTSNAALCVCCLAHVALVNTPKYQE